MKRTKAFYENRNASTTKSGPGRYHVQGHKKSSPVASKGGLPLLVKEPRRSKVYETMAVSSQAVIAAHNAAVTTRQVLRRRA